MKLKSKEEIRQIIDEAKDEIRILFYSSAIEVLLPNIKKALEKEGSQAITPIKEIFKLVLYFVFLPVLLILLKDYIGWQIAVFCFRRKWKIGQPMIV